ncbi:MAG: GNAT family protein [Patescibacteria group bacterium]|jgi:RimJ/RimL family protein N-acetyltransferase
MKYAIKARNMTLRSPQIADAPVVIPYINDRLVKRFTTIPSPYRKKDWLVWVKSVHAQIRKKQPGKYNFMIEVEQRPIGSISLDHVTPKHKATLGYWLAKEFRNKGIMQEAVGAITRFGFAQLKLQRIEATVDITNKASRRVLEKNGFKVEGVQKKGVMHRGQLRDVYMLAKVR